MSPAHTHTHPEEHGSPNKAKLNDTTPGPAIVQSREV